MTVTLTNCLKHIPLSYSPADAEEAANGGLGEADGAVTPGRADADALVLGCNSIDILGTSLNLSLIMLVV